MAHAMRSQRQEINQTISTPLLDAAMALGELINGSVLDQDKGCIVAGLSGGGKQTLISLGIFDRLPKASFANDLEEARQAAVQLLPK